MSNTNKEAPSLPLTPTRSKPTDDTGDKPIKSPINLPLPKDVSTPKIDCPRRLTKFPTRKDTTKFISELTGIHNALHGTPEKKIQKR